MHKVGQTINRKVKVVRDQHQCVTPLWDIDFFIACVQISFISFVVDFFLPFTSLLRYQELHFQIPSPVLLSPCYQQKQIGIPQQNKLYLLHFSLFSRDTIYNNAKMQL